MSSSSDDDASELSSSPLEDESEDESEVSSSLSEESEEESEVISSSSEESELSSSLSSLDWSSEDYKREQKGLLTITTTLSTLIYNIPEVRQSYLLWWNGYIDQQLIIQKPNRRHNRVQLDGEHTINKSTINSPMNLIGRAAL